MLLFCNFAATDRQNRSDRFAVAAVSGFELPAEAPANPVLMEVSLKATPKPSSAMSATHQKSVVSKRQAERMRRGRVESRPEDYKNIAPSEHAKRLHEARSRLEDRKMLMELGLL